MDRRSLCIVLRASNYRENDRMLTLFSRDYGKIDALARGCRKPTSSLLSSSDVLCCSDMSFNFKEGRYYVVGAEPRTNFYDIRKNMKSLMTALLLIEITERNIVHEEPNRPLFALLSGCLYALANGDDHRKVLSFFTFKLFESQGERPPLTECVICGKPSVNRINIKAGGAVCADCEGLEVEAGYIDNIARIYSTKSKDILTTDLNVDDGFYGLAIEWLKYHESSDLKSLALLG